MIEETTHLHSTTLYWTNYVTTPFLTANLQKLSLYFAFNFKGREGWFCSSLIRKLVLGSCSEDHLSALGGWVLKPCGGGLWSPRWVEVENTGTKMAEANPPSAPCNIKDGINQQGTGGEVELLQQYERRDWKTCYGPTFCHCGTHHLSRTWEWEKRRRRKRPVTPGRKVVGSTT